MIPYLFAKKTQYCFFRNPKRCGQVRMLLYFLPISKLRVHSRLHGNTLTVALENNLKTIPGKTLVVARPSCWFIVQWYLEQSKVLLNGQKDHHNGKPNIFSQGATCVCSLLKFGAIILDLVRREMKRRNDCSMNICFYTYILWPVTIMI